MSAVSPGMGPLEVTMEIRAYRERQMPAVPLAARKKTMTRGLRSTLQAGTLPTGAADALWTFLVGVWTI